jgi:hypothetical protein
MNRIIDSIAARLQSLTIILGILGAILIFLVTTSGVNLPVLAQLTPNQSTRWFAGVLGVALLAAAVYVQYRPPSPRSGGVEAAASQATALLPTEVTATFAERETNVSPRQREILDAIFYSTPGMDSIGQEEIEQQFPGIARTELYYRIEQLRLLGFVQRERAGYTGEGASRIARYIYCLTAAYQEERNKRQRYAQGPTQAPDRRTPGRREG